MRDSVELARQYPLVNLHTHLAETKDEDRFCLEVFGKRPVAYAESLGWAGEDVWFAHMVHPNSAEVTGWPRLTLASATAQPVICCSLPALPGTGNAG